MPHNKSTKKRVKTNEIRRQRNAASKSHMRHAVRDLRSHAAAGTDAEQVQGDYKTVSRMLDRMVSKGVIHRNKAARLKSRLNARASS